MQVCLTGKPMWAAVSPEGMIPSHPDIIFTLAHGTGLMFQSPVALFLRT